MKLKKSSLKNSKYTIIIIFFLLFISLISARMVNLSKEGIYQSSIDKQSLESIPNVTKNIFIDVNNIDVNKDVAGISSNSNTVNQAGGLFVFLGRGRELYNDLPSNNGIPISQYRPNNNIFKGETLYWNILVFNWHDINNVNDVYTTIGGRQGSGNNKWSSCVLGTQPVDGSELDESYNARILEEHLTTFDADYMRVYDCYFVAGDRDTLHGEYWITVEASNSEGDFSDMDENEFWFLNPTLGLNVDEALNFRDIKPGQTFYSNVINIKNVPEEGSGVIAFLEISGENLQKVEGSDSLCNGAGYFSIEDISYYAENNAWGIYNTTLNLDADDEGFVNLPLNDSPIMENYDNLVDYFRSNTIYGSAPFKLRINIPDNCYGSYSEKIKITGWVPGNPNQRTTLEIPVNLMINRKEPDLTFSSSQVITENPLPGTAIYSQEIIITNNDVPVNLYISGTDFYDSTSSGARCSTTNQLSLSNIKYYAENGNYSTRDDLRADSDGYVPINYGIEFNNPNFPFYESHELIQASGASLPAGDFNKYSSNILEQGNIIHLKFRLNVPIPCNGNFDTGSIYIWTKDQNGNVKQYPLSTTVNIVRDPPQVFKCGNTSYLDDNTEPGRVSQGREELVERMTNYVYEGDELLKWKYLFEGEQIKWRVFVLDRNGIEKVKDVYATIGSSRGAGNDIEANCHFENILSVGATPDSSCNAVLNGEEQSLTNVSDRTAAYYTCTMTIETADSMYGMFWTTVEAEDNDGNLAIMNESELIFANPIISLSINDSIKFENLTPGKTAYSNVISVESASDEGSGVVLDMFISGTDFYSLENFSYCPEQYKLGLNRFSYKAEIENYSTMNDLEIGGNRHKDEEGYININYGVGFNNPNPFYNRYEIIQDGKDGVYYLGNQMREGQKMDLKFKIDVPKNCTGSFDNGNIYFWGEAI